MNEHLVRNPHNYIPADFQERSKLWMNSARNLVTDKAQFIYLSVENLMFAERSILQMEKTLARQEGKAVDAHEPWLLKECAAHSILWLCGLYEVTRTLKNSKQYPHLLDLHKKVHIVRIPLAKGEVSTAPRYRDKPHYPTSVWSVETGRVGWQVFNPSTASLEVYSRSDLADEFLEVTARVDA